MLRNDNKNNHHQINVIKQNNYGQNHFQVKAIPFGDCGLNSFYLGLQDIIFAGEWQPSETVQNKLLNAIFDTAVMTKKRSFKTYTDNKENIKIRAGFQAYFDLIDSIKNKDKKIAFKELINFLKQLKTHETIYAVQFAIASPLRKIGAEAYLKATKEANLPKDIDAAEKSQKDGVEVTQDFLNILGQEFDITINSYTDENPNNPVSSSSQNNNTHSITLVNSKNVSENDIDSHHWDALIPESRRNGLVNLLAPKLLPEQVKEEYETEIIDMVNPKKIAAKQKREINSNEQPVTLKKARISEEHDSTTQILKQLVTQLKENDPIEKQTLTDIYQQQNTINKQILKKDNLSNNTEATEAIIETAQSSIEAVEYVKEKLEINKTKLSALNVTGDYQNLILQDFTDDKHVKLKDKQNMDASEALAVSLQNEEILEFMSKNFDALNKPKR